MIKSKREFRCVECDKTYIKWIGICTNCKKAGTIQEVILIPGKAPTVAKESVKKIARRAKNSERNIGKRMIDADGADPAFRNIASSTGRVGHITGMRIDTVSRTYVTENKNRKLPTWLIKAWLLINQRGISFNKNILLHLEPPNMPKDFPIEGRREKLDTMALITQTRHEDLIKKERLLNELENKIFSEDKYLALRNLF